MFVSGRPSGVLGRNEGAHHAALMVAAGDELQVLVENQGRINHGPFMVGDFKGLGRVDGSEFSN